MSSFGEDFWCSETKKICHKMFAKDYDPEVCKACIFLEETKQI